MTIIDISPVLSKETAVFPGDHSFERKIEIDFSQGSPFSLSSIHTSAHIGAHTDAPTHYHPEGSGMSERSLHYYYGECQVIEVFCKPEERITPSHIQGLEILAPRVLFKTNSFPNPEVWKDDFNSLSAELISYLASREVILVGIDTPSIDPSRDKTLESHKEVYKHNMAILEGIVLDRVQGGLYCLSALPLKIKDGDASPVRAVLIKG